MSIVERIKRFIDCHGARSETVIGLLRESAAEIKELRAENERLRKLLAQYGDHTSRCMTFVLEPCDCGWPEARAALGRAE